MIDAKLLNSIQILALKSIEDPDIEDIYRQICRWYSREFSTPLIEVEDMDQVYILQHYFENRFKNLAEGSEKEYQEYERIKAELLFPEEERKAEQKTEDWVKQLEEEMKSKGPVEKKSVFDLGKKLGTSITSIIDDMVKETTKELNLINNEGLNLPDSGSFGEE